MAQESYRQSNSGQASGSNGPAAQCPRCELELVTIVMTVDGNDLVMESCETCDERRWHLAGEKIDLQQALAQVGEHAGRRR